ELEVPALLRELAQGRGPRILLVHGSEPLLVEELLERLAAHVGPDPAAMSLNREVFHADTAAPEAVIDAGGALGLFGGRRLVLVRGVGDLSAKTTERLRAAVEAARARRGGWPTDGTMVVFAAVTGDRRAPGLRLLPERDQVEVRGPSGRAVVGWLRERARSAGLDLAPEAAQALLDLIGEDLSRLLSELEKAVLYAGAEPRVSEEGVRALAGETRVSQYWE